jgi:hypothetical protein
LLTADGHLVEAAPAVPAGLLENHYWNRTLASLPYAGPLLPAWKSSAQASGRGELDAALALYAFSQDRMQQPGLRFAALEFSFNILRGLCNRSLRLLRLASLARVAAAYGARGVAVDALGKLTNAMLAQQDVDPGEPFVVPASRFDTLPPGGNIADWLLAAALEELERLERFSSFYAGPSSKQRLDLIHRLGFGSEEMQRRLALVNQRFGFT